MKEDMVFVFIFVDTEKTCSHLFPADCWLEYGAGTKIRCAYFSEAKGLPPDRLNMPPYRLNVPPDRLNVPPDKLKCHLIG